MTNDLKDALVQKIMCKMTEVLSMMKNGEFIVAYEKLGGIQKNLYQLGSAIQEDKKANPPSDDKSV